MAHNIGGLTFCGVPSHYESMLGQISDKILRKFYDNFKFLYLHLKNYDYDKNQVKKLILSDFIKDTKFLTYKIERLKNIKTDGLSYEMGNAIICIEKQCLIIESININFLHQIIKSTNSKFIDTSSPIPEETDFCEKFHYLICPNPFVRFTIHPILAYLIKRFYYPSYFFKDQSFFEFDHLTSSTTNIDDLKVLTEKREYCDLTNEDRLNLIKNKINSQNKCNIIDFKEDDFIKLKTISSTSPKVAYYLVMHVNSLHIFTMKTITTRDDRGIQHEIEFCKNYSHRCIIKFYGFVRKNQNIAGFIYEFMSNGNLYDNVKRNKNEIESFIIINRIFQAVDYLHSNHLINRDIKPSNILFDHNNVPYMSDLETIRKIDDINSNKESFTFDIGTEIYSSPEQDKGENISYSTDYFSFGLVIYYLFEKKEIKNSSQLKEYKKEFPPLNKGPKNIQYLYQKCVKINPNERLTKNEIYTILLEETKKLTFFNDFNITDDLNDVTELIHYFFENLMLIISNISNIKWKNDDIINWYSKFYVNYLSSLKSEDFSSFLFIFGVLYDKGCGVDRNISKAKTYYELSIKNNDANSLLALGIIYIYEGNYEKAIELLELSAKQNNDEAFYNLGILYYNDGAFSEAKRYLEMAAKLKHTQALILLGSLYENGQGVEQNQSIAIEYYKKAVELKDVVAILILGNIYLEKQDFAKSKEYFELASTKNNSKAFLKLGIIYFEGLGVDKNISKAKEYFELSAKLNNSEALLKLGNIYLDGIGFDKNISKAKEYFELSAQLDNSDALFCLGELYYNGTGVEINYSKAINYYILSAQLNNSKALFKLGYIFLNIDDNEENHKKAFELLKKSAELNNPAALYLLGSLYLYGIFHVKKDYMKALEYLEKASEFNDSNAIFHIGKIYFNGWGVEQNKLKSLKFFKKSADLNNNAALYLLGEFYEKGQILEQNFLKAKEYYELSAKQNNPNALNALGKMYFFGLGIEIDYLKAKEKFKLALKYKNSESAYYLGIIYELGYSVKQDFLKAKEYYEISAKENNSAALNNLGDLYLNGNGVELNYSKALYFYELSAKQNDSDAYLKIGYMHLEGLHFKQNFQIAKELFELSAKQNNQTAFLFLGNLYMNGDGVEKNYSKARKYYELSAQQNNSGALCNLGFIYLQGLGVEKNYSEAKKYFEKSAKDNNSLALFNLGQIYILGFDEPKDLDKAKYYFEKAAKLHNSNALIVLGSFCLGEKGMQKDYSKAKKYFERAAELKNSEGYFKLSELYLNGWGVSKDIKKAKKYLEISASLNNPMANFKLGLLYAGALKDEVDLQKTLDYFELAVKQDIPGALYYLGLLYSTGIICKTDINKAINCYERCIKHENEIIYRSSLFDSFVGHLYYYNIFKYQSYNDLGLIYITIFEDVNKSKENLKEAAFGGYPFGQNNYGLLNQFYLENIENAKHFYKRSSEHNFCLAEFNYGHILESEGKIEKAMEFYVKASEHEGEQVLFNGLFNNDIRLENSKKFIICLTNLKLFKYYLLKSKNNESKKYFVQSFSKINNELHIFQIKIIFSKTKNIFENIKSYILQSFLNDSEYQNDITIQSEFDFQTNSNVNVILKQCLNDFIFYDPSNLFDFAIQNEATKRFLISEIDEIIKIMETELYKKPYLILFGQMASKKQIKEKEEKSSRKNINGNFYEGFGNIL